MNASKPPLFISCPDREFVLPYLERELPKVPLVIAGNEMKSDEQPAAAVMISGTELYIPSEGENLEENTAADGRLPLAAAEVEFTRLASDMGLTPVILRCANIIGTGMTGFPHRLAASILQGTFFHFPGNEARLSVVHASEIARLTALIYSRRPQGGNAVVYNVCDSINPTLHDLAEALAFRMDNRRISNLSTRFQRMLGRLFYGRTLYRRYTSTLTFSNARLRNELDFEPCDTLNYMRTHVYDHSSL